MIQDYASIGESEVKAKAIEDGSKHGSREGGGLLFRACPYVLDRENTETPEDKDRESKTI